MRHTPTHEKIRHNLLLRWIAAWFAGLARTTRRIGRQVWSAGSRGTRRMARRLAVTVGPALLRVWSRLGVTVGPVLARVRSQLASMVGPVLVRGWSRLALVGSRVGSRLAPVWRAVARSRAVAVAGAVAHQAGLRPVELGRTLRDSTAVRALRGGGVATSGLRHTTRPVRFALAFGVLASLGVVAVSQGMAAAERTHRREQAAMAVAVALAEAQRAEHASRSQQRTSTPPAQSKPASPKKSKPKPTVPAPVAGLDQTQMNNAYQIVAAGKALGMPKQAYVIAIATALQESELYNLASDVLPESYQYPHQGTGSDHDSVGLFQQRPSSGWGSVADIMNPRYAATQFYNALRSIGGWQNMALTYAAQAVQGSAFPDAYAQHEWVAQQVVDALT
jgi:hypothetical protein